MSLETLLVWLVIGAIAGWLAGVVVKGSGSGLMGNIVIGILGAFIGGWLFGSVVVGVSGIVGAIIGATLGAIILLAIVRILRRAA